MLEKIDPTVGWELTFIPRDSFHQYSETTLDIPAVIDFATAVRWLTEMYPEVLVLVGLTWAKFTYSNIEAELTTYGTAV